MEEKPSHASNNILDLTLEIVYLLTGEDYEMVKKASSDSSPDVSPLMTMTPPDSLTPNTNNDKKILEVIKKMIKLLTGEEWEYLEGHKDLYKDVMMEDHPKDLNKNLMIDELQKPQKDNKKVVKEDHQNLPSLDGSSNGNPPERCPRPLYSRDNDSIFDQLEELMDINVKVKRVEEEETYVRDGQQSMEEDVVMVTDGSSNGNPPERCPRPLYSRDSTQEGHTIPHHHQSGKFQGYNIVVKEEFKEEDEEYGVMEFSEEHKEVMKKPTKKRNLPKRCSSPLDSGDSTPEGLRYTQFSQTEDLSDMKIEIKKEGETYAMGDLSTEEDGTAVTVKEEDSSLDISSDDVIVRNSSKGHPFPEHNTKDNGTAQYSPGEKFANPKIYLKPESADKATDPFCPREPSIKYDRTSSNIHTGIYNMDSPLDLLNSEGTCIKYDRTSSNFHPGIYDMDSPPDRPNPEGTSLDPTQRGDEMSTTSSTYNECFTIITLPLVYQPTPNENHPFICTECGKCFQTRSSLVRHESIHSGMRPYSCSECGKGFSAKSHLERHQKNHTGDRPYSCPECEKCFKQRDRLNAHLRVHKGETPFTCAECKKSFIDKAHFVSHQRVHTGEKPFSCPECGKCFSQTGHLNIHLRLHTGEKAFSCSECGKSFTHKSTLINHQRFHTGEQPFSCTVCGKRFTRKMNLDIHQKFNTKDSTSSCWECGMQYRTKCEMKIHQKTHPKKKIYSCSMCPKSFSYKSEFLRHQRSHTG